MPELWIVVLVAGAVVLGLGLAVRSWRPKGDGSACQFLPEGREGELAVRLADMVGCGPREALPAVQHELDLAPAQTDDVILKRAAYHYRNAQPERRGAIYRDKVRG